MPGDFSKTDRPDITQSPAVVKSQKERLQRKFGVDFPDLDSTNGPDWRRWVEGQRRKQEPIMRDKRLHWARHRHFRAGQQWISTRDGRLWREPQSDVNDLRPVLNVIGPALDFRLGILSEQRPGFRHEPIGGGVAGREAAEAQQAVAEYYFYVLRAWNTFLDAWFHAQTDGVSFIHVYVDNTKGPSQEDLDLVPPDDPRFPGLKAQGYEVGPDGLLILPFADEGVIAPPGSPSRTMFKGDIACKILLAHEVLFSPEARSINGPTEPRARWALVRRMRDVNEARLETGDPTIESEMVITSQSDVLDMPIDRSMGWQRGLPPFPTRRQRIIDGVPEYLLWIAPDQFEPGLEQGRWMRLVGNVIVEQGDELPGGIIPLARFTDGSPDTDVFPRPVMSDWIGDQTSINALLGALLKHARYFAGGRILATKSTVLEETYSNVVGSVVEYQGMKPDVFPATQANPDAWKLLDWLIKKLEDKTGWSDIARGQMSQSGSAQDVSGRAVLASQQLFERTFGPAVRAAAEGATEWAHLVVRYAQWLFDEPRLIPAVGGRGDLAKRISAEKLGDRPVVYVDPETLMPMPRALRQQLLEDQLDKGRISLPTYQKRSVYADVRDIQMGDTDQWQRAMWINTLIEDQYEELAMADPTTRYAMPGFAILWQDVALQSSPQPVQGAQGIQATMPSVYRTVHKDALMDIILDERKPWGMRQLALERWGIYDQLERAMNDPTGATQIPPEVLGIPPDKLAMMMQQMMPPTGMPGQAGPASSPPPASAGGTSGPATSPAPESSGTGIPAASQQGAKPLGQFGAIERAAMAQQQQQT
jgi:hypothetical protein